MKGKKSCGGGVFHTDSLMNKKILLLPAVLAFLPSLAACGKQYDYTAHISEAKRDIFRAETEEFTLVLSCVEREHPYCADGIVCPKSNVVEISLTPAILSGAEYQIYVTGKGGWGGEASFRNTFGDYFLSRSVEVFPEQTVSLRVEWENEVREIAATSVKNEATLTVEEALSHAVTAEKETVERMFRGKNFCGEFYVRLLRRDKNYYYVGIVDGSEEISLLLDAETGELLARRPPK